MEAVSQPFWRRTLEAAGHARYGRGARHLDYRISIYQPMAYVEKHSHKVQEQIYHILDGEGLMEIDGVAHVVRKHDVIFLAPGIEHSIANSGLADLVFLVITSPVTDDATPA
jgi:quercetin dioxygenase-like cupin family protein